MPSHEPSADPPQSPQPARSPSPPARLGRYRIIGQVGAGGFGVVYRGYDEELHRDIAIKVPHAHRITSEAAGNDFLAEARNLAVLDHPGIVPVYDVGRTEDGTYYIVFKFIEGHSLAAQSRQGREAGVQAV